MDVQNASNLQIPQGEVKTIHDSTGNLLWGRLSYDVKYNGDMLQNGSPSPDNPITVQIVTGTQSISIDDGKNDAEYNISIGSIELCKIGDYQDYIYKSGDAWYVHKEIAKVTFTGTENWTSGTYGVNSWYLTNAINCPYDTAKVQIISNIFRGISSNDRNTAGDNTIYTSANTVFWIRNTLLTTLSEVHSATSGNYIYYALATPTDTQITDTTLINQLNGVDKWLTRAGYEYTIIGNLPIILDRTNL